MIHEIEIPCVGYSVKADWYDASHEEVVLILIGFTSAKSNYVNFANTIVGETGRSVLVLDYSGHGVSPFNIEDLTPAQNFLEVISVFDWLKGQYPEAKISVIGTSYGSFLATHLTEYRLVDSLVLRVPALYEPDNFYTKWRDSDMEKRHDYRLNEPNLNQHPLFRRASDFNGKALVVTHELDELCPPNSTKPFIEAFNAESWEEKGLKHGFGESGLSSAEEAAYFKRITDWMKK